MTEQHARDIRTGPMDVASRFAVSGRTTLVSGGTSRLGLIIAKVILALT